MWTRPSHGTFVRGLRLSMSTPGLQFPTPAMDSESRLGDIWGGWERAPMRTDWRSGWSHGRAARTARTPNACEYVTLLCWFDWTTVRVVKCDPLLRIFGHSHAHATRPLSAIVTVGHHQTWGVCRTAMAMKGGRL